MKKEKERNKERGMKKKERRIEEKMKTEEKRRIGNFEKDITGENIFI